MDKILNRMYDIFAFALPGMSILASVLIFRHNGQFLFQVLLEKYDLNSTWFALVITFLGYITGYLLTPFSRKWILIKLGIGLNHVFHLEKVNNEKLFKLRLQTTDLSEDFVRIREKTTRTSEYIEFWDMHINFSSNMAFAMITGLLSVIIYSIINSCFTMYSIILIIIFPLAFILFIRNALHYANWWVNDIDAALKYDAES